MDPHQTAVYAKAHDDLQELFRQIARHGRVTAQELQLSLLPFTAGDAKCDLQELVDDMKHRQTSLDEADFIRVMWRKMYLNNLTYTAQHTAKARPASASAVDIARDAVSANIPIAHVIVSIKRRAQLKQFASYYASRGISGADRLDADKGTTRAQDSRTPRHLLQMQKKRRAAAAAAAQAASMAALRGRESPAYDVVACYYDGEAMRMKVVQLYTEVRAASVANCSRLYSALTTAETGPLVLCSSHFVDLVRTRAARQRQQRSSDRLDNVKACAGATHSPSRDELASSHLPGLPPGIGVVQLERLGLRNTVAMGVGRGVVTVATERRVHTWTAFATPKVAPRDFAVAPHSKEPGSSPGKLTDSEEVKAESEIPPKVLEFLEDEGDTFGHVPLLKRAKTVGDIPGIRTLACGDRFAIGVTTTSELYAWGSSSLGRNRISPTKLVWSSFASEPSGAVTVSRVVCGLHHVMLLSSLGALFTWGSNVHGQLGHSADCSVVDADVLEPTQVKLSSVVMDVACGDHHSIALTDKGTLFAWGNNWHGQLGLDPSAADTGCVFAPTKVSWWLNREQSHGETDDEGLIQHGGAVTASTLPPSPQKTADVVPRLYLITAVGDTTAVVSEQGQVFMWGKCVPPGPYAGACGMVARWRPQRLDMLDELLPRDYSALLDGDDAHPTTATTQPQRVDSLWSGIAIANGLILLTKHAVPATIPPAFSTNKSQHHSSKKMH